MKLSARPAGMVLAITILGCLASLTAAAGDPRTGTWKLDLAKSTFSPGPPPKSQTLTYFETVDGLAALLQGIDARGKPINPDVSNMMIVFDGKDHPTPMASYDVSAWQRLDAHTYRVVRKKGGKVVLTSINVISQDGMTMTITTTGVGVDGAPIRNVRVFERQ